MDLSFIKWEIVWEYRELFIRGIWVTLILTLAGYVGGIILGLLLGIGKLSKNKWIYLPSKYYVDFFRGTPLLVQLLLIHLALIPAIFGQSLGYFVSGIVALTLNSAAYNAEIIRAGIQSIEKGQNEAARSLGMTSGMAMRQVILPQALRRMIPPMGNEFIALLKDSSLISVIAASDILYAAKVSAGAYSRFWEPYIAAALLYLLLTYLISLLIMYVENRFSNSYVPRKKSKIVAGQEGK